MQAVERIKMKIRKGDNVVVIVEKENPIHASNVSLIDPKDNKPTRIGFKVVDGRKLRVALRSGEMIDR
jgi:large subunit ribosomal protein L24